MALTQSSRGMQIVPNRFKESAESSESNSKLNLYSAGVRRCVVVPVIYYLSRNGQLEHPHFMEVALSSSQGLFLRDVMNRLNFLRGKGMANHYSWSAKRGYKNGYVWQDLEENDFIHPVHGQEYILKGSEILEASTTSLISNSSEAPSSSSTGNQVETTENAEVVEPEFPLRSRRRNQSWSSININEYKVYKASFSGELSGKAASDASTQTDEKRHRRRQAMKECEIVEEEEEPAKASQVEDQQTTELSQSEISPPPSDSSPETLESLMKSHGNLASSSSSNQTARAVDPQLPVAGKPKPASILASLISCGSISFRDCGAAASKDHGFSLISHYRARLPRGGNRAAEEVESVSSVPASGSLAKMAMEDKEYFSGSLVETRKDEAPSLQRSSSYNADRRSQMRLAEKEMDGVRAKCIPRKQRGACPPPPPKELGGEMAIKGRDA